MKIKSLFLVALAAIAVTANAVERKFYDAVVYQAPYGNPKSITWIDSKGEEYLTVNFSQDGKEINESSDVTYLPNGLRAIEEHSALLATVSTTYEYDNVPPNAVLVEESSGMSKTCYFYPEDGSDPANQKNPAKVIHFVNSILGVLTSTTEYSDYVNDRVGNWISRSSLVIDDNPLGGSLDSTPTHTTRRIEYWDTDNASPGSYSLDYLKSDTNFVPVYSWSAKLFGSIPFGSVSFPDLINILKANGVKYEADFYNKSINVTSTINTFLVDKGKKTVTCQFNALLKSDGYMFGSSLLDKKEVMLLRNDMLRILEGSGVKMNKGDAKPYGWKELYWGKVDGHTVWVTLNKIGSWSIHVHVFAPCWK